MNRTQIRRRVELATIVTTLSLIATPAFAGSVIFVDADAGPGGDGTSWQLALQRVDDALDLAGAGDSVWIAEGTYTPAPPGGSRDETFLVGDDVAVYGGFIGDETIPEERDLAAHQTILSGDLNGDDGPEFENFDDNSLHVVTVDAGATIVTLDGLTISGGSVPSSVSGGAGILADGSGIVLRHCTVRDNITGLYGRGGDVTIDQCVFRRMSWGPAVVREAGIVTVTSSRFLDNHSQIGTLSLDYITDIVITDCEFAGNVATEASGAVRLANGPSATVTRCHFHDNVSFHSTVFAYTGVVAFRDCVFSSNRSQIISGVGCGSVVASFSNCVFSRNEATGQPVSAAIVLTWPNVSTDVINCTFSKNEPAAIFNEWAYGTVIRNSIFWGNAPEQLNGPVEPDVAYSIVEGGWSGPGNLDADPLFVQPGSDNVRLAFGSPALDAGSNAEVPSDVETDLAGDPRIQNGFVDIGAYEGAFEALPPASSHLDVDPGDVAVLLPDGDALSALENTIIALENTSDCDDATATATEHEDDMHPAAAGYSGGARTLQIETTLTVGQFMATIVRPFDADDLQGADPLTIDLTCYDETAGNWALAVFANTAPSPEHATPIGDRIEAVGPGYAGITTDVGDYGVYWDPTLQKGFVWANVDHLRDTGFGLPLCPSDCAQPPDGATAFRDLLAVIRAWGHGVGPFDIDDDGVVSATDLVAVITNWGSCP
ncbi:MAG: right-handed parallel beta-helix repeat-containing protein [Planctomycetes bacterium]|nr:right-handed parallel beta-helix repeat-containing protein [Planctomycetota bacterium]